VTARHHWTSDVSPHCEKISVGLELVAASPTPERSSEVTLVFS
jgi:hypothetical protein